MKLVCEAFNGPRGCSLGRNCDKDHVCAYAQCGKSGHGILNCWTLMDDIQRSFISRLVSIKGYQVTPPGRRRNFTNNFGNYSNDNSNKRNFGNGNYKNSRNEGGDSPSGGSSDGQSFTTPDGKRWYSHAPPKKKRKKQN